MTQDEPARQPGEDVGVLLEQLCRLPPDVALWLEQTADALGTELEQLESDP